MFFVLLAKISTLNKDPKKYKNQELSNNNSNTFFNS